MFPSEFPILALVSSFIFREYTHNKPKINKHKHVQKWRKRWCHRMWSGPTALIECRDNIIKGRETEWWFRKLTNEKMKRFGSPKEILLGSHFVLCNVWTFDSAELISTTLEIKSLEDLPCILFPRQDGFSLHFVSCFLVFSVLCFLVVRSITSISQQPGFGLRLKPALSLPWLSRGLISHRIWGS